MGSKKEKGTSIPYFPSETGSVRNTLTSLFSQEGAQQNPWYSDISSMFSNVLGAAASDKSYQVPQATQDIISNLVSTGGAYKGDITADPIYQAYSKGYQSFIEPALADVRESQGALGGLRTADTERLQGEAVGRIGEQLNLQAIPQVLSQNTQNIANQLQGITAQQQSSMYPLEYLQSALGVSGAMESPSWLYPLLQLASQYATAGAGAYSQQYQYPGEQMSGGISCCWTFLEAEGEITQIVRRYRDEHFGKYGEVGRGYREMSGYLVPLMKIEERLKNYVRVVITQPLTIYAEWYYGKNNSGYKFKGLVDSWVSFWRRLGKEDICCNS